MPIFHNLLWCCGNVNIQVSWFPCLAASTMHRKQLYKNKQKSHKLLNKMWIINWDITNLQWRNFSSKNIGINALGYYNPKTHSNLIAGYWKCPVVSWTVWPIYFSEGRLSLSSRRHFECTILQLQSLSQKIFTWMRICKCKDSAQKSLRLTEFFNDISVFCLLQHANLPPPKIADIVYTKGWASKKTGTCEVWWWITNIFC